MSQDDFASSDPIDASAPRGLARVALAAWLIGVVFVLALLWRYDSTPGLAATAPSIWPADARVALSTDRPTLLVTLHAYCPCSSATISEVAWVADRAHARFHITFLVEAPDEVSDDALAASAAYRLASAILGASVVRDRGGHDAALLDAHTSGQTYLYEPDGSLAFAGGLTWARGHEGDSDGRDEVLARIDRAGAAMASAAVFGCPLEVAP